MGEAVGIIGVSGSGKSTLLGLLAGLDLPTEGHVIFDGQNLNTLTEDERAKLRLNQVGFIFQDFQLLPKLTALENVMLPLELKNIPNAKQEAIDFLKMVGLDARLSHYPKQLSGGEQQRISIARAFAMKPSILFADEPTANLDQKTGRAIIDLLFNLNEQSHTTLVCVTHDPILGERCTKRIHLEGGRLLS